MKTFFVIKATTDDANRITGYVTVKNGPQIDIYKYRNWGTKFYNQAKAKSILSACKNIQFTNPHFFSRQTTFIFEIEKVSKEL